MAKLLQFEPDSSNHISRLQYDPDGMYLYVLFTNQSSYTFAGVPAHVFAEMTRAPSSGKFFHSVIKRHYKLVERNSKETV